MARLIDADKRIAEIKKIYCDGCDNYGGAKCRACWVDDAMCLIDDATVVDAVPVVRCRECVGRPFWEEDHNGVPVCLLSGLYVRSEDDFCSYGERKEGAE